MTKPSYGTASRTLLASVLAFAGVSKVQAQPEQPKPLVIPAPVALPPLVAIPQIAGVSVGVVSPNVASVPAGVATPNAAKVSAALMLGQMEIGQITPEQAWATGALSLDEVVHAANAFPIRDLNSDRVNSPLLQGLLELLVQHGQELWLPMKEGQKIQGEPLSHNVRLGVADILSHTRDERAIAVYEDMLKEIERAKAQQPQARTVGALNHLASFYWGQGQLQKAADIFMSGERYSSSPEWAAAIRLDAARVYTQMGNKVKAKELYDQIANYGSGWINALALYDQALPLIEVGKSLEGKALLSQTLRATSQQREGEIAQNAWLALYDYQEGRLEDAFQHGKAVLKAGENFNFRSGPLKNLYTMGYDIYVRAGGWKTQPIQCDLKEIVLKSNPLQPNKPLYARFRIKTYGDQSVAATIDNPAIQVHILPIDNWQRSVLEAHEEESEMIVLYKSSDFTQEDKKNYIVLKKRSDASTASILLKLG